MVKKRSKVNKFCYYLNFALLPLTITMTALGFSSSYLEYVTHQSNAAPEDIKQALENHKFIKETIFPHSYEKELENVNIYVRSIESINYLALAMVYGNNQLYSLINHFKENKNVEYIEQYTYDYADKIKGQANAYLYKVYKYTGKPTEETPRIYLSADNSVIKRFQEEVFDGNLRLAQDMVFFHEFTHHLQRTVVAQSNTKAILNVEDLKKSLKREYIDTDRYSSEHINILHTLFQEGVADIMALQLLEVKYPALDIEYLADNLAIFRNTADIAHFTSLALMELENSNPKSKTFTQMYEIAQNYSLRNLKNLLVKGLEQAHNRVDKLSSNRGTFQLYKAQYNVDIKNRYLDITVNYNNAVQNLHLDKPIIENTAVNKFRVSTMYKVKNN